MYGRLGTQHQQQNRSRCIGIGPRHEIATGHFLETRAGSRRTGCADFPKEAPITDPCTVCTCAIHESLEADVEKMFVNLMSPTSCYVRAYVPSSAKIRLYRVF